jgi:O-antigen ligase
MKRTELIIFLLTILLCSTVQATSAIHETLTVRNLIWGVSTLVLLILISTRYYKEKINLDFVFNPIFAMTECLLIMGLISCFFAINLGEAFYGVAKLIGFLCGLFVTTVIIKEYRKAVFIFLSILPLIIIPYSIYTRGLHSNGLMSNRNLWSSALFMLIPFCVYSFARYKFKPSILSIVMIVAQIDVLFTRSAMLALFVFVFVLFWAKNRLLNTIILGAVTVIIVVVILNTSRGPDLRSTETMNWRKYLWFNTLKMALDKPLGVGVNNWKLAIPNYISEGYYDFPEDKRPFNEMWFRRPHNKFLTILSEMSIVGLGIYIAMLVFTLLQLNDRILVAGLLGSMTIMFFSFPTELVFHTMILLIFMGTALSNHESVRISFAKQNFYPFSIVLTLMMVACIYDFGIRYQSERRLKGIMYLRNVTYNWPAILKKTRSNSFLVNLHPNTVPIDFYRGEAKCVTGRWAEGLSHFEKAITQNPHDVKTLFNLSGCYAMKKQYDKAMEASLRVLELCPTHKNIIKNINEINDRIEEEVKKPAYPNK